MTKTQFVELVQAKGEYKTKIEADKAIDAVTAAITEALASKEEVSLIGFGSFTAALQKGKTGTIPGTDRTYTTEDKMVPRFSAGKTLKDSVATGAVK